MVQLSTTALPGRFCPKWINCAIFYLDIRSEFKGSLGLAKKVPPKSLHYERIDICFESGWSHQQYILTTPEALETQGQNGAKHGKECDRENGDGERHEGWTLAKAVQYILVNPGGKCGDDAGDND